MSVLRKGKPGEVLPSRAQVCCQRGDGLPQAVCGVVGVVLGVGANRQQVVEPPAAAIIKGRKVVEGIQSAAPICFQDRQSVAMWGQEVRTTRTILTFCRGDGVLAGKPLPARATGALQQQLVSICVVGSPTLCARCVHTDCIQDR